MKAASVERNIVAALFVLVFVVFSLAQHDSRKRLQKLNVSGLAETPLTSKPSRPNASLVK